VKFRFTHSKIVKFHFTHSNSNILFSKNLIGKWPNLKSRGLISPFPPFRRPCLCNWEEHWDTSANDVVKPGLDHWQEKRQTHLHVLVAGTGGHALPEKVERHVMQQVIVIWTDSLCDVDLVEQGIVHGSSTEQQQVKSCIVRLRIEPNPDQILQSELLSWNKACR